MTSLPFGLLANSKMLVIAVLFCTVLTGAFLAEKLRLSIINQTVDSSRTGVPGSLIMPGWVILIWIAPTLYVPFSLITRPLERLTTFSFSEIPEYLIGAFGLYAGICVLLRLNGSSKIAKAYLWLYAFNFATFFLLLQPIIALEINDPLYWELMSGSRVLIFFTFWCLYLIRSKRVKAAK